MDVVLGDATDQKLKGLPEAGTVDLLTISYALTMIPSENLPPQSAVPTPRSVVPRRPSHPSCGLL